jgi:transcription antitermination factor NusG
MPATTTLTTSGCVKDWPESFTDRLPTDAWLVLHSYPRQEKRLMDDLRRLRIPGCVFFQNRIRHYRGKGRQMSLVPLIGGYVFVAATQRHKENIYATKRVVRIIDVSQPHVLARDLAGLCKLVSVSTEPLVVRPEIVPGKLVDIRHGTFSGCTGVVVRRQNRLELVVNLEMLGTSVSVTLPAELAELA